jgi:hypothetical protein
MVSRLPFPFIFTNDGAQLLQQPDNITIIYSDDYEVRHVRMNQLSFRAGNADLVWEFGRPPEGDTYPGD